ncbi:MAG: hypothetical protein IAG13_15750 [Deltaproteobacteria bacterium]|nr:hypothetical protein [Nannocystaceae bacterium]
MSQDPNWESDPRRLPWLGASAIVLAGACASDERGDSGAFSGTDVDTVTQGSTPSASDPSGTATEGGATEPGASSGLGPDGSSGGDPKFDVGTGSDLVTDCDPDERDCGCTAVDIIFVVDNSGSMQEHAAPTIAAFSLFVDEMVSVLPADTSVHVGVTRATGFYDPGNGGGWSGPSCEASLTDGSWNPPDVADNGTNGQQGRLFEHEGLRYFELDTGSDPQPLAEWFQGALTGAIDGSAPHSNTETVVAGAAYPFHPANAGYNAGFMREQAVLVLFLLSDSPDLSPPAIPTTDFVEIVSDAKSACGDFCVIPTGAIAGACYDQAANTNTRLTDFMNGFAAPPPSWTNLQSGMVPDFEGVLGDALADVIGSTCMMIPPEG